jgi:hypothetical protein
MRCEEFLDSQSGSRKPSAQTLRREEQHQQLILGCFSYLRLERFRPVTPVDRDPHLRLAAMGWRTALIIRFTFSELERSKSMVARDYITNLSILK